VTIQLFLRILLSNRQIFKQQRIKQNAFYLYVFPKLNILSHLELSAKVKRKNINTNFMGEKFWKFLKLVLGITFLLFGKKVLLLQCEK